MMSKGLSESGLLWLKIKVSGPFNYLALDQRDTRSRDGSRTWYMKNQAVTIGTSLYKPEQR